MNIALALLLFSPPALVQAQPSTLTGIVADDARVPLGDSRVRLFLEDGRVLEYPTSSNGEFSLEIAGSFEIEISHAGYRSVRTTSATLTSGGTYEV
jgi:hypothetical protein